MSDFETSAHRQPFPSVTVASVQMAPHVGRKDENVTRTVQWIEQAASGGAELVVLPELSNTGYVFASHPEAFSLAESVPDGPTTEAWIDAARRCNVHVVAGIAEREGAVFTTPQWSSAPKGGEEPTGSSICGATNTCFSKPAIKVCRSSTRN